MYLAFHSVHAPIQVPFKYLEMYNHLNDTKSKTRRKMMAMVTALDDNVGKIVQHLKKRDLFDNTIFLFTSDVSFSLQLLVQDMKKRMAILTYYSKIWGSFFSQHIVYNLKLYFFIIFAKDFIPS